MSNALRNESYWKQRMADYMDKAHKDAVAVGNDLLKQYQQTANSLSASINANLSQYGMNRDDWKQIAESGDLVKLSNLLGTITDKDDYNLISNISMKSKMTREEYILTLIQLESTNLAVELNNGVANHKMDIYQNVFNGLQPELNFMYKLPVDELRLIMSDVWIGNNTFSESIWKQKEKLSKDLTDIFTEGYLKGTSASQMAKQLEKAMLSSYKEAYRLVVTESAYITNKATLDAYKQSPVVVGYEVLAFIDGKECDRCRALNGQQFLFDKNKDIKFGSELPPLHPHCRCCLIPITKEIDLTIEDYQNNQTLAPDTKKDKVMENFDVGSLDYLMKKHGINVSFTDGVSADQIPREYITAINRYYDKLYKDYPKLNEKPYKLRDIMFYARDNGEGGSYNLMRHDMALNMKNVLDDLKYEGKLDDITLNKIISTFIHESAHMVDNLISRTIRSNKKIDYFALDKDGDFLNSVDKNKRYSYEVYKQVKTAVEANGEKFNNAYIRYHLGDYATTNKEEFFAEAYKNGFIKDYISITQEEVNERNTDYYRQHFGDNLMSTELIELVSQSLDKYFK